MRYPEFRDRLERVLQDAGLFAFGFNRTETIDLANASRHWKFYMMSGARQKAEPFHISAEIARQVEMARSLGMNPKKLPSLRPSPDQRWKLPVGKFIESCYGKRFGGDAHEHPRLDPESRSSKPAAPKPDLDRSKASGDTMSQLEDLSFTSPIWSPIWKHGLSTAPSRRRWLRN